MHRRDRAFSRRLTLPAHCNSPDKPNIGADPLVQANLGREKNNYSFN
jgi:hypothetical protein